MKYLVSCPLCYRGTGTRACMHSMCQDVERMHLCPFTVQATFNTDARSAMRRCWNYSTQVGHDAEHAQLCERCAPVIRGMGFQLPSNGVPAAAAAEPAQAAVTL